MESTPLPSGKSSDEGKDDEYDKKFKELQKYVPFLKGMIRKLESSSDKVRDAQLSKMKNLYNILSNPKRRLKIDTLDRCEEVLNKLEEKLKTQFGASIPLPDSPGPMKSCKVKTDQEVAVESPASPPQKENISSPIAPKIIPVERCTTVERDFSKAEEEVSLESSRERLKGVMISQKPDLELSIDPSSTIMIPGLDMLFSKPSPIRGDRKAPDEKSHFSYNERRSDEPDRPKDIYQSENFDHSGKRDVWSVRKNIGEQSDGRSLFDDHRDLVERADHERTQTINERHYLGRGNEGRILARSDVSLDSPKNIPSYGGTIPSPAIGFMSQAAPLTSAPIASPPSAPIGLEDVRSSRGPSMWYADNPQPLSPVHTFSTSGFHQEDNERRRSIREKLSQDLDKVQKLGVSSGGSLRTHNHPREEMFEADRRGIEPETAFHDALNTKLNDHINSINRNRGERDPRRTTLLPTPPHLLASRGVRPDPRMQRDSFPDSLTSYNKSVHTYGNHPQIQAGIHTHTPNTPYGNSYSKNVIHDPWSPTLVIPPSRTTIYHHGNSSMVQLQGSSAYQWQTTCTTVKQTTAHDLGYRYQPRSRQNMPHDREALNVSSLPRLEDGHSGNREIARFDDKKRELENRRGFEAKSGRRSFESRTLGPKVRSDYEERKDGQDVKNSSSRKTDSEDDSLQNTLHRGGTPKVGSGRSIQSFKIPKVRRETTPPPTKQPTPPPPVNRPCDPRLGTRDPRVARARSRPPSPQPKKISDSHGQNRSPSPQDISSLEVQPVSSEKIIVRSPSPVSRSSHSRSRASSPHPARSRPRSPSSSRDRSRQKSPTSSRARSRPRSPSTSRARSRPRSPSLRARSRQSSPSSSRSRPSSPSSRARSKTPPSQCKSRASTPSETKFHSRGRSPTTSRSKVCSPEREDNSSFSAKSKRPESPSSPKLGDGTGGGSPSSAIDENSESAQDKTKQRAKNLSHKHSRYSRSRSRSNSRIRAQSRSRKQSRSCSRSSSRGSSRSQSEEYSRSNSAGKRRYHRRDSRSCSEGSTGSSSQERYKSHSRRRSRRRSLSRRRSRGRSRARSRGRSRTRSRTHSRTPPRGRSRARSSGRSKRHSRVPSRGRSRDNSPARSRQRSTSTCSRQSVEQGRSVSLGESREHDKSSHCVVPDSRRLHSPSVASSRSSSCSNRISPARDHSGFANKSTASKSKDVSSTIQEALPCSSSLKSQASDESRSNSPTIRPDLINNDGTQTVVVKQTDSAAISQRVESSFQASSCSEPVMDLPTSTSETPLNSASQKHEIGSSSEQASSNIVPNLGGASSEKGDTNELLVEILRKCLEKEDGKKLLLEFAAKTLPSEKCAQVLNIFNDASVKGNNEEKEQETNAPSMNAPVVDGTDKSKLAKETRPKKGSKNKKTASASDNQQSIIADVSPDGSEKQMKRKRNELDKLHQDIKEMFISKDVVTATGQRSCRLRRESKETVASTPKTRPGSADDKTQSSKCKTKLKDLLDLSDESPVKDANSSSYPKEDSEPSALCFSDRATSYEDDSKAKGSSCNQTGFNGEADVVVCDSSTDEDVPISQWIKLSESDGSPSPVRSRKKRPCVLESESDSDTGGLDDSKSSSGVPCVVLEKMKSPSTSLNANISRNTARRGRKFGGMGRENTKRPKLILSDSESEEIEDKDMSQIDSSNIIQVETTGSKLTRSQLKRLQGFDIESENSSPVRNPTKVSASATVKQEVSLSPKKSNSKIVPDSYLEHTEVQDSTTLSVPEESSFPGPAPSEKGQSHQGHVTKNKKKLKRPSSWQRGIIEKKSQKSNRTEKTNDVSDETSRKDCAEISASLLKTEDLSLVCQAQSNISSLSPTGEIHCSVEAKKPICLKSITDLNYVITDGKAFCKLCDFQGKTIVGHYKSNHSEWEVLISRLPLDLVEVVKAESDKLHDIKEEVPSTKEARPFLKCLLCKAVAKGAVGLFEHISTHTGEYRYQCVLCGYSGPFKKTMKGHYHRFHSKETSSEAVSSKFSYKTVISEPPSMNVLYGYMCSECNFFQLQEENIKNHLEAAHIGISSVHCIRIKTSQTAPALDGIKVEIEQVEGEQNLQSQEGNDRKVDRALASEHAIVTDGRSVATGQIVQDDVSTASTCSAMDVIRPSLEAKASKEVEKLPTAPVLRDTCPKLLSDLIERNRLHAATSRESHEKEETKVDVELRNSSLVDNAHSDASTSVMEQATGGSAVTTNQVLASQILVSTESTNTVGEIVSPIREGVGVPSTSGKCDKVVTQKDSSSVDLSIFLTSEPVKRTEKAIEEEREKLLKDAGEKIKVRPMKNRTSVLDRLTERLQGDQDNAVSEGLPQLIEPMCRELCSFRTDSEEISKAAGRGSLRLTPARLTQKPTTPPIDGAERRLTRSSLRMSPANHDEAPSLNLPDALKEPLPASRLNDTLQRMLECMDSPSSKANVSQPNQVSNVVQEFSGDNVAPVYQMRSKEQHLVVVGGLEARNGSEGVIFICRVEDCLFTSTRADLLLEHVREEHYHWKSSFHCNICGSTNTVLSLPECLAHLQQNHVVEGVVATSSTFPFNSNAPATCASDRSPAPHKSRTLIRPRRLPGDTLSEPSIQNPVDSSTEGENELPSLVISSVVSLSKDHTPEGMPLMKAKSPQTSLLRSQQRTSPSEHSPCPAMPPAVPLQLDRLRGPRVCSPGSSPPSTILAKNNAIAKRVMTETQNVRHQLNYNWRGMKDEECLRRMLTAEKLRHLFKCKGYCCSFSTNLKENFAEHYQKHARRELERNPNASSNVYEWQKCVYCGDSKDSGEDLMDHILTHHNSCRYQCSFCFYRAAYQGSVVHHQNLCHTDEFIQVLECRNLTNRPIVQKPAPTLKMNDILAYHCAQGTGCEVQFLTEEEILQHLNVEHSTHTHFTCSQCKAGFSSAPQLLSHYSLHHGYSKFYCLHCPTASQTLQEIAYHMCTFHPDEEPVTAARMRTSDKRYKAIFLSKTLMMPIVPSIDLSGNDPALLVPQARGPIEREETDHDTEPCNFDSDVRNVCSIITQVPGVGSKLSSLPSHSTSQVHRTVSKNGLDFSKDKDISGANDTQESGMESQRSGISTISHIAGDDDDLNDDDPRECGSSEGSFSLTPKDMAWRGLSGTALYRCGNSGCTFNADNSAELKDHLLVCDLARDSHILSCAHCQRPFKQPAPLLEHLQKHSVPRYCCSLCDLRVTSVPIANRHMKQKHRVTSTEVVPLHPLFRDPEKDLFSVRPKDWAIRKGKTKAYFSATTKTMFGPEEIAMLPLSAVFTRNVICILCNYSTKVRSNMVRHLEQHASGREASPTPVVNPVPCLERSEKMFDTMTNHAVSSNMTIRRDSNATKTADEPKFVPENKRYICCAPSCLCVSSDDGMLRHHIRVLHTDVLVYKCPHCSDTDPDLLKHPIMLDKVGSHLKMHGSRLYSCLYCTYHHYKRHQVERHTAEKHSDQKRSIRVVREPKPGDESDAENIVGLETEFSMLPAEAPSMWECGICSFQGARADVVNHVAVEHRIHAQFKCGLCNFRANNRPRISAHFSNKHGNNKEEIIAVFRKLDKSSMGPSTSAVELATITEEVAPFDSTPLWQRDARRLRHLRGILFEENGLKPKEMEHSDLDGLRSPSCKRSSVDLDTDDEMYSPKREKREDPTEYLVLKFGAVKPASFLPGFFICPKCSARFAVANKQEFCDHLYKEINYRKYRCTMCTTSTTSRIYIRKHAAKSHKDERMMDVIDSSGNDKDSEDWVNMVFEAQSSAVNKTPSVPLRVKSCSVPVQGSSVNHVQSTFTLTREVSESPSDSHVTPPPSSFSRPTIISSPKKAENPAGEKSQTGVVALSLATSPSTVLVSSSESFVPLPSSNLAVVSAPSSTSSSPSVTPVSSPTKKFRGTSILKKNVLPMTSTLCSIPPTALTTKSPTYTSPQMPSVCVTTSCSEMNSTSVLPKEDGRVNVASGTQGKSPSSLTISQQSDVDESAFELDIEEVEVDDQNQDSGNGFLQTSVSPLKYHCIHCDGFTAKSKQDLRKHEMQHWETKPYKCSYCDFQSIQRFRVRKHFERVHPTVDCTVEENVMPDIPVIIPIGGVRKRYSTVVEPPKVTEDDCTFEEKTLKTSEQTDTPINENDATSTLPDSVFANIKLYRCGFCRLQDTSIQGLIGHWQANHRNFSSLVEDFPGRGKLVPFKYRQVLLGQHEKQTMTFRCGLCAKTGTAKVLMEHVNTRHVGQNVQIRALVHQRLQCSLCPRQFSNKTILDTHFRSAHPGHLSIGSKVKPLEEGDEGKLFTSFECSYCHEIVENENNMRDHHLHFHSHLGAKFLEGAESLPVKKEASQEGENNQPLTMESLVKLPVARKSTTKFRPIESQGHDEYLLQQEPVTRRPVAKKSTSKVRSVARKSTGGRCVQPGFVKEIKEESFSSESDGDEEGFSFYGYPRQSVDVKRVSIPMMFGPTTTRVNVATISQCTDIYPVVEIVDLHRRKDIPENIHWSWPSTPSPSKPLENHDSFNPGN